MTIQNYYTFSELAFAAYSDLEPGERPDIDDLMRNGDGMSLTQSDIFRQSWTVIDQYDGVVEETYIDEFGEEYSFLKETGLSVTLLEDNAGNQTVAIRGTNDLSDLLTDVVDIALLGSAEYQDQYKALSTKVQQWLDNGDLNSGFSVTGHSLGGFLTQALATEFDSLVSAAYTFNAPGFSVDGLTNIETEFMDIFGIVNGSIPTEKITNIRSLEGPSATAGLGQMLGSIQVVSIENQSPNLITNHYMAPLVDSLALQNIFYQVDSTLIAEDGVKSFVVL